MDYIYLITRIAITAAVIMECKLFYDNIQLNKEIVKYNQSLQCKTV